MESMKSDFNKVDTAQGKLTMILSLWLPEELSTYTHTHAPLKSLQLNFRNNSLKQMRFTTAMFFVIKKFDI